MEKIKCLGLVAIGNMSIIGIRGGFGVNNLAILVKDVAKIHKKEVKNINKLINNNRERFADGVDILDLKLWFQMEPQSETNTTLKDMGLTPMEISKANNIYLLSERGYFKLIKLLDDNLSFDIYEQLLTDYFCKCEELETLKKQVELPSYQITDPIERATAWIEEQKQLQKLQETNNQQKILIEEQTPKVEYFDAVMDSTSTFPTSTIAKQLGIKSAQVLNKILCDKKVQIKRHMGKSIYYVLSANYVGKGLAEEVIISKDTYSIRQLRWTEKGAKFIRDLLQEFTRCC